MASDKSQTELSSIGITRIGSRHPQGTTIDFILICIESDRRIDTHSSSSLCIMQLSDWSKPINMAAVITGINEDDPLSATTKTWENKNYGTIEGWGLLSKSWGWLTFLFIYTELSN